MIVKRLNLLLPMMRNSWNMFLIILLYYFVRSIMISLLLLTKAVISSGLNGL